MQYLTDEKGKRTSVILTCDEWDKFNFKYKKLKNKLDVLKDVSDGLKEIEDAKKNNTRLQSLSDFLNESSN